MGSLYQGAKNAVEVCMGVKPNERVLIVTDKAQYEVGDALQKAALKITPHVSIIVLEDFGKSLENILPEQMKKLLPRLDVTFWATEGGEGETALRLDFINLINFAKKYVRHAHMPGITKQVMEQGMCSDYKEIYKFTNKLYEKIKDAKKIEVTTLSGTILNIEINPKWKWILETGMLHKKGDWTNLPAGELSAAPLNVNGRIVVDELGAWFDSKYGVLSPPENKGNIQVQINIKDSRADLNSIKCKNRKMKKDLLQYLKTDKNSSRVGEFSFPTNLEMLNNMLIGNVLQDEKARMHIAFGYPETGAKWKCKTHIDCLMKNCDVWADGRKIMENDRYLI